MKENHHYCRWRASGGNGCGPLRQQGFTGELHLFSDERHLPYERPPLSKSMLLEDSRSYSRCYPLTGGRKTMFICIPV